MNQPGLHTEHPTIYNTEHTTFVIQDSISIVILSLNKKTMKSLGQEQKFKYMQNVNKITDSFW